jgi:hypothetical protein
MDEFLELKVININNETVYVNRFGDLWRYKWNTHRTASKFEKCDNKPDKSTGYIRPEINGKRVRQHRIICAAFLGLDIHDKKCQVDHINGIRHDNRLENLRLVNNQQNQHNQTKAKGYTWYKALCKWQAYIKLNDKKIHLGYFENEEDARNAYLEAKLRYHKI